MTNIISYTFNDKPVRTETINNNPFFCLNDCCGILELKNSSKVVQQLDPKGITKSYLLTSGGKQKTNFINEPNLYRLIFRSNKPEAQKFANWVYEEVLPQIRKTGKYEAVDFEKVLTTPVRQHTRKLPTVRVKKEINLAESSIKAVSVIVANTIIKKIKEQSLQIELFKEREDGIKSFEYVKGFHHGAEAIYQQGAYRDIAERLEKIERKLK